MSQNILKQVVNAETADSNWKSLYKLGAAAAWMVVLAFLLDIAISFAGGDFNPATLTATEWFILFQENTLSGLRALGLINILSLTVSVALYLALYAAHRQGCPSYATLALILFLVGATTYISNNAAIPMFVLSGRYAAAATEAQRTLFAAAGEAILVRGADFAPGSFIGFFLTEMAGLAFSLLMLRGRGFGKATAFAGILGFTLLTIFTVWTTFIPVFFDAAMVLATAGGLSSVAWYILVARRLFRLGSGRAEIEANRKSMVAAH